MTKLDEVKNYSYQFFDSSITKVWEQVKQVAKEGKLDLEVKIKGDTEDDKAENSALYSYFRDQCFGCAFGQHEDGTNYLKISWKKTEYTFT